MRRRGLAMRILLAHRYYYPDVTTQSRSLRILGQRLVKEGYNVAVYAAQPGYNGASAGVIGRGRALEDGMRVHRIRLGGDKGCRSVIRLVRNCWYAFRLLIHALVLAWPRYDVVVVSSMPPILSGTVARIVTGVRGGAYVIQGLDIYPEVAEQAGLLDKRGLVPRALKRLDSSNYNAAAAGVVLSEDMKITLENRGVDGRCVRVINNMILAEVQPDVEASAMYEDHKSAFVVVFAGNLGRFQGLEVVMDAARLLSTRPEIRFVFIGDGDMRNTLEAKAGSLLEQTVFLYEHKPLRTAMGFVAMADLALVTLAPGVVGAAYPSKLMTNMEAGSRMVVVVEQDSQLARFVNEHDLGEVCEPGDPSGIAGAVLREYGRHDEKKKEAARIRQLGREHFGQGEFLARWVGLMEELEDRSRAQRTGLG